MKKARKKKTFVVATLLVAGLLAVFGLVLSQGVWRQQSADIENDPRFQNTLLYAAVQLKKQGITRPEPRYIHAEFPRYDDYTLLRADSALIVVATAIDQRYRPSSNNSRIETITKLRVDDVLKGRMDFDPRHSSARERTLPGAESLGPVEPNHLLVIQTGGFLKIEDVLFRDIVVEDQLPLTLKRQYVLFLNPARSIEDPSKPPKDINYGHARLTLYYRTGAPQGVVLVEGPAGEKVRPGPEDRPDLNAILERRFGSDRNAFTNYLRGNEGGGQ